mgnify:CR=1 FL=1
MARTAALEAARAEAPATPVRESAAVGAVGAVNEVSAWRVLPQFLPVNVSLKSDKLLNSIAVLETAL